MRTPDKRRRNPPQCQHNLGPTPDTLHHLLTLPWTHSHSLLPAKYNCTPCRRLKIENIAKYLALTYKNSLQNGVEVSCAMIVFCFIRHTLYILPSLVQLIIKLKYAFILCSFYKNRILQKLIGNYLQLSRIKPIIDTIFIFLQNLKSINKLSLGNFRYKNTVFGEFLARS